VTLRQLAERVIVEPGDHRAEEIAKALCGLGVKVDENEAIPHVTWHRSQTVVGQIEVEELRLLLDKRECALQVVPPPVVLAGELTAGAASLVTGKIVPHQLVSTVAAHVVEGTDLVVFA